MKRMTAAFRPALALAITLVAAACDKSATGVDPEPVAPTAPTVATMAVTGSGTVYLRATLAANVTDVDGDIADVTIDWGDGTTFTVANGFDAIKLDHDFPAAGKTYTVTLTARDAGNLRTTSTKSLKIDPAPRACFDVKVIGVCYQTHPNYKGADLVFTAFDNKITSITLSTTKNDIETFVPVAGIVGQAKVRLTAGFSGSRGKSSIRLRVYSCTLFTICSSEIYDKTLKW
ncbi:MAG: PKD domain-containing protein [Gemmatimonadota bacterium]